MKRDRTELRYTDNIKTSVTIEIPHDKYCRYIQPMTGREIIECQFFDYGEENDSNSCQLFHEYLHSLDEYHSYVIKCSKCLKLKSNNTKQSIDKLI